jgi:hypothetical protein
MSSKAVVRPRMHSAGASSLQSQQAPGPHWSTALERLRELAENKGWRRGAAGPIG